MTKLSLTCHSLAISQVSLVTLLSVFGLMSIFSSLFFLLFFSSFFPVRFQFLPLPQCVPFSCH